jgi:RNA polymerase sigma-70 factor, ECF subfamily
MPSVSERILVLVAAGATAEAATEAIRGFGPPVLRYVRTMLPNEADANDAFSIWAESLWSALPHFRGESSLRTWSLRIAHHAVCAILDQGWRRRVRPFATGEASRLAKTLRTATAVYRDRQRRKLDAAITRLSPDEQTLLALRIDQALSWEEIAEVLSAQGTRLEPKTLAKRYERLKRQLATLVHADDG